MYEICPNPALAIQVTDRLQTPVGMSPHFIHLSPNYFPDPQAFIPDRWIGSDAKLNTKLLTPFGKGTRMCIGSNLATAELHVVAATIVRRFQFELFETTREDVEIVFDAFVGQLRPESEGVRVKVVGECA